MKYILSFLLSVVSLFSIQVLADEEPMIVILGDSLSAGYGMDKNESWVYLLENRLADNGFDYKILNSSISGDTTQGGLSRLPRLLDRYQPQIVIIELGGNDGLRGLDPDTTRDNIRQMIIQSQAVGAHVLLAGIKLPPNYGSAYIEKFETIYSDLALEYHTLLVPFFMQDVVFNPELMQADGIHPSAKGQPVLLDNVWQILQPALAQQDPNE
jgi:acyl-CoA thioesterase-1